MACNLYDLTVDGRRDPVGIDTPSPVFSWKLRTDEAGVAQKAYRVQVFTDSTPVWSSGWITSDRTAYVNYAGNALSSLTEYAWSVDILTDSDETASAVGAFETAYMNANDWHARWVEPAQEPAFHEPVRSSRERRLIPLDEVRLCPANFVRREFSLNGKVARARINATAHGVYTLQLNGSRVGDIVLAPGSTAYDQYLEYQTYDVTDLLQSGANALLMCVADGWYVGKHGMIGQSCSFGDRTAVLFQIEIFYEDGRHETIGSDDACRCHIADVDYADLFVGERRDARKYPEGCDLPGFDDAGWNPMTVLDMDYDNLKAQYGDPVRVVERRRPERVYRSPKGEWMLDCGTVLAGRLRMRVKGDRGTVITLEHTETVDDEGCYFNNINGFFTHQTDTFILAGGGEEEFCPEYTFHGFQYVRITGWPGDLSVEDFDVEIISSDLRSTGSFECSNPYLNRLQHNIVRSQVSNLLSVPTDCPQREKSGWTGDAHFYAPTACFNADTLTFYRRWLRNMRLDQQPDGQIPMVIPYIPAYRPGGFFFYDTHTSAGWGDCAVFLPWTLYRAYGDLSILEENYNMMRRWVEYIRMTAETELPEGMDEASLTPEARERQKYLWNTHVHFGDWLAPSVCIDPETGNINLARSAFMTMDIVPTCWYAGSTMLMAKVARALGKAADAEYYDGLHEKVREAFLSEYLDENGLIRKRLQGVYVLALTMDILRGEDKARHAAELVKMIRENGDALDTGFVSVPYLLDALCDNGYEDVAEALMLRDECPSWLYMVLHGATTMWEAWQAVLPDGTKTNVSYNHYALGCVGQWMYRKLGGLDAALPGYKRQLIDLKPRCGLNWAKTSLETPHGLAAIAWRVEGDVLTADITVPPNTTGRCLTYGKPTVLDGADCGCMDELTLSAGIHTVELRL